MDDDTKDAAIIAAAQRVEHYEIAGYGTARTYANLLGESEAAELLGDARGRKRDRSKTYAACRRNQR